MVESTRTKGLVRDPPYDLVRSSSGVGGKIKGNVIALHLACLSGVSEKTKHRKTDYSNQHASAVSSTLYEKFVRLVFCKAKDNEGLPCI